jgi:hypothetical protein
MSSYNCFAPSRFDVNQFLKSLTQSRKGAKFQKGKLRPHMGMKLHQSVGNTAASFFFPLGVFAPLREIIQNS